MMTRTQLLLSVCWAPMLLLLVALKLGLDVPTKGPARLIKTKKAWHLHAGLVVTAGAGFLWYGLTSGSTTALTVAVTVLWMSLPLALAGYALHLRCTGQIKPDRNLAG